MTAIVTNRFKKDLLDFLVKEVSNPASNYYVAIGKSEAWNELDSPDMPINNYVDENKFRQGMQGVIKVSAASLVVARYDWASGTTYSQWDDKKVPSQYTSTNPFFAINNDYGVYICLRTGRDSVGNTVPSTVQPTLYNNDPFETSDGYVWQFLYTISTLRSTLFMSKNYMPVQTIESVDSNSSGIILKQWQVQQSAVPKMITSFIVDSSETGFINPTLEINENLITNVDITLDSDSRIAKIEYKNDSSTLSYLSGYNGIIANIIDSSNNDCLFRPVLSSNKGVGKDPVSDLLCNSMMLNVKIAGEEEDFITTQDFRQIALIKNVKDSANGSLFTELTAKTLPSMSLSSNPIAFTKDRLIVGAQSGATAYVDDVNQGGTQLWYHQNDSTGFLSFISGETINEDGGQGNAVVDNPSVAPEVDPWSGDILYLHNRTAVERVPNQTEDIKIVIELTECGTGLTFSDVDPSIVLDGGDAEGLV